MVLVARPRMQRHGPTRGGGGGLLGVVGAVDPYDPKKKRRNGGAGTLFKQLAVLAWICLTIWIGLRWIGGGNKKAGAKTEDVPVGQPTIQKKVRRRSISQKAALVTSQLDQLAGAAPLSPTEHDEKEALFLEKAQKECLPGRDDVHGEINPTTRRKRECLRHVPLGKGAGNVHQLERLLENQKPRIGVLFPPGFIGNDFGNWIAAALKESGTKIGMEVEVLSGSHVPVYGYGKSHGFTKLIRFVSLPLSLAVYDAYLLASAEEIHPNKFYGDMLHDTLDEMKLGRKLSPPSIGGVGTIARTLMRWHCRLSHVSAHTAMLTLSLWDVAKDPTNALARILTYIWKEDWEWEGQGGSAGIKHKQGPPPKGGWRREAERLVERDDSGALEELLDHALAVLEETTPSLRGDDSLTKAMQGAFAAEMRRSEDMTSWPCPSFWEGVELSESAAGDGGGFDEARAVRRIAGEMVPDCGDDHPFARCSIKRDKCEVKRDAKCS